MNERTQFIIASLILLILIFLGGLFAIKLNPGLSFLKAAQNQNKEKTNIVLSQEPYNCLDSDGVNEFFKGRVYFSKDIYTDYCLDQSTLHEYYCDENIPAFTIICISSSETGFSEYFLILLLV